MSNTQKNLINLIKCAIKSEKTELSGEVNWSKLCYYARLHHVENIIYPLIADNESFKESKISIKMKEWFLQAKFKEAKQEIEANRVMDAFEKAKIVHIPLKGHIIKNLYPSPDMRQSTDFDVYVPFKNNKDAMLVMDSLGYSYNKEDIGIGMHDNYSMGAFMEVEVHKSLMAPDFPVWCKICDKLVKNATKSSGFDYRYEFSKEDYYIYMQLHTIKHLKYSSCGIKPIIDMWIYLEKYENELDFDYINKVFTKGGLTEVDKNLRLLYKYWFMGYEVKDEKIYALADYIFDSGAFGTEEQYLSGRKADTTKTKRMIKMFFMPYSEMAIKYPILKKVPILLPFLWIYRGVRGAILRKGSNDSIEDKAKNIESEKIIALSEFKRKIGL